MKMAVLHKGYIRSIVGAHKWAIRELGVKKFGSKIAGKVVAARHGLSDPQALLPCISSHMQRKCLLLLVHTISFLWATVHTC